MKPGDLRRFSDTDAADHYEGDTFIVLKVNTADAAARVSGAVSTVDILLNSRIEEGLGYFWVEDNSEVLNETR